MVSSALPVISTPLKHLQEKLSTILSKELKNGIEI